MPPSSRRRPVLALLVGAGLGLAFLAVLELAFRWQHERFVDDPARVGAYRRFVLEGRAQAFVPRPYFGFARPRSEGLHNDLGFIGPDWQVERTPGVTRIACLGGSTTEGGNPSGLLGSYPFLLERALERATGEEFEVMNFGISGWTTAEIICAWFLLVQDYEPDLVILHEVVNDVEPRAWPGFRPDYSHYRRPWTVERADPLTRWLVSSSDLFAWAASRRALPKLADAVNRPPQGGYTFDGSGYPAETRGTYERNLRTLCSAVRRQGGDVCLATLPTQPPPPPGTSEDGLDNFRVGIAEHNQVMRDLASAEGYLLCDLAALQPDKPGVRELFRDLVHVEPHGNQWKASRIRDTLLDRWLQR